jgi:hypothetical protein
MSTRTKLWSFVPCINNVKIYLIKLVENSIVYFHIISCCFYFNINYYAGCIYDIFSLGLYTYLSWTFFSYLIKFYILCYGTSFICQSLSNTTIIFSFGFLTFIWGCTIRASLEMFEMNALFKMVTFL